MPNKWAPNATKSFGTLSHGDARTLREPSRILPGVQLAAAGNVADSGDCYGAPSRHPPARAGVQSTLKNWIPASAEMTGRGFDSG